MRVAFLRHVGPYDEVGETWGRLTSPLGREGHLGGEQMMFGICYDDPAVTPAEKIRYDACVTVNESFAPFEGIETKIVEGGEFAVATYQGPYSGLSKAYNELFGQWLPRSGRELRNAPPMECYLNSPENTEPSELLTDIFAPIEPLTAESEKAK